MSLFNNWKRAEKISLFAVILAAISFFADWKDVYNLFPIHGVTATVSNFQFVRYGDQESISVDLFFRNNGTRSEIIKQVNFCIIQYTDSLSAPRASYWPDVALQRISSFKLHPGEIVSYRLLQPIKWDNLLVYHNIDPNLSSVIGQPIAVEIKAHLPDGSISSKMANVAMIYSGNRSTINDSQSFDIFGSPDVNNSYDIHHVKPEIQDAE